MMRPGRYRLLWRVGVPAALAAAAATVLVILYLGRPTGIPAIRSSRMPSEGARKLKFECNATLARTHWQWKWPCLATDWSRQPVLMADLPQRTLAYIQSLIEEDFVKANPWGMGGRWDPPLETFDTYQSCHAKVEFFPLNDRYDRFFPNVIVLTITIEEWDPETPKFWVATCLLGTDGTILYKWGTRVTARSNGVSWECKWLRDGLHIFILDAAPEKDPDDPPYADPVYQEYLLRPGEEALAKLRDVRMSEVQFQPPEQDKQ